MALYKGIITVEVYVSTDDEDEVVDLVLQGAKNEICYNSTIGKKSVMYRLIRSRDQVNKEWLLCLPYSKDDKCQKTVDDLLSEEWL